MVPIEGADTARREVKLRLLAARHFAAVPLAGTGETAAAGGGGVGAAVGAAAVRAAGTDAVAQVPFRRGAGRRGVMLSASTLEAADE